MTTRNIDIKWLRLLLSMMILTGSRVVASEPYRAYADANIAVLQTWYDLDKGTWKTTGWWNSANALEAVIDYSVITGNKTYKPDIANTFEKHKSGSFLNKYYDDEGWWALTWIKAYDLTHETRYLDMAKRIFEDMKGGWDDTFGGGIWWNKDRKYKNAIANELFLTLAARLHQRTPGDKGYGSYLDWAQKEWRWFESSGMINEKNLINDGLNKLGTNNGGTVWTYNQGVILGGLAAMADITHQKSYLARARAIADAAIKTLVSSEALLTEPCEKKDGCGGDGSLFKGIFLRNLSLLYKKTNRKEYLNFITSNADSIWKQDRSETNEFGLKWAGPFDKADASRQSSALDAFNAAAIPTRH